MPTYGLTSAGFVAKPLDVIQTEIKTAIRGAISPTLNLGTRSLIGQLIGAFASQTRQVWEASQAVYTSMDPSQAEGDALTARAELTGTRRDAATASFALMTLTLAAGTYPVGTLLVNRTGDATVIFTNRSSITTAGATLTGQIFDCTTTGPVSAPAGTLITITSPVSGFSAPTNPADAELGQLVESDPQLREKRQTSVQRAGSSSVDAIRADLLELDDVIYASVLENDTDTTDANGIPPHSIWAIVLGGLAADIARIIFESKAGGPGTKGTDIVVTVTDASGNGHTIRADRPDAVAIKFSGSFDYLEDAWESPTAAQDAVKAALLAEFAVNQGVGRDVIHARYVKAVMAVSGAIDIALGQAKLADSPTENNITINPFEYTTLDVSNITITAIAQGAAP